MPVTVEEMRLPSGQDLEDLQKIYEDAPGWVLEHWSSSSRACAIQALINSVSENDERYLYVARFNSRLLAAIFVDEKDDGWLLHRLCVRAITRSRGVGGRLLERVVDKAKSAGKSISLHDPQRQLHDERLQKTIGDYQLVEHISS